MPRSRIDFARFDIIVMQIGSNGVPPQVLVTWEIEPIRTGANEITFHLERSESPSFDEPDDIESIVTPFVATQGQTVYEYLDVTVNLQSFWRRYYYRVRAVDTDPAKEYSTDIKTWESDPKTHELEIIARHDWLLRYETGTPCFALVKRTTGGGFCQECYNESLSRSTKSNCEACYGTGRERPYFSPILTFVDYNPPEKVTVIQTYGELQSGQTDVWWSATPQLKPDDILVEVMSGKRWRVARVNTVGDVRTPIHHFGRLEMINHRDIEYRIAISEVTQKQAVSDLEDMKRERRF